MHIRFEDSFVPNNFRYAQMTSLKFQTQISLLLEGIIIG